MSTLRTNTLQTTDSAFTINVADIATSASVSGLASDLAATTGSGLVGFSDAVTYAAGTVGKKIADNSLGLTDLTRDKDTPHMYTQSGIFTGGVQAEAMLWIGDSNSAGNGQAFGFQGSLMGRAIRSVLNSFDNGLGKDRGYMHESLLSMVQYLIPAYGYSGNGSYVSGGVTGSRFQLTAGQILTLTGREITQMQIWYDPALSTGNFTVDVNGVTAYSAAVNGTGTTNGIALEAGGGYIYPTDLVTITSTTGTKIITGVQAVRAGGSLSPLIYAAPEGSQGFSDFSAPARVTELAAHVNSSSSAARKLIVVLLGTNNMIATVGKQLTPAAYITALDALIVAYKAALGGDSLCSFAVWVPPRPQEALPLAPYEDYVTALINYANTDPRIDLIRMDKTILRTPEFYTDTLHLNEIGHTIAAKVLCDSLGIPLDCSYPAYPVMRTVTGLPYRAPAFTSPWSGAAAPLASRKTLDGEVKLTGGVTKSAGGGTSAFATLAAPFRPSASRVIGAKDQAGAFQGILITGGTGAMTMLNAAAVSATTQLFFDGESFEL